MKKKSQNKSKTKSKTSENISLSIKYDDFSKKDEFKVRILERIMIRVLDILENKRP